MFAMILGLLAATSYGAADFYGGLATKRATMFSVAVIGQAMGLAILLVVVPLAGSHAVRSDWLLGLGAGVCGGLGIALLYHALSIGKMGVVSPITAILVAALPVLAGFVRGERLTVVQMTGIVLALVAIVLISLSFEENGVREISTEGVREAIASGVLLGAFFVFLAYGHPNAGLSELLAARFSSVVTLAVVALALRSNLRPPRVTLPLILISGALDVTATTLYTIATRYGDLSIVAVLTSLYPASTVFLARVVLNEHLSRSQQVGIVLALLGVALIAL
jgi:drug/metabolite transporter (DMT)-like permease